MALGPLLLLLASAALIVGGVFITVRDVRAKRNSASRPEASTRPTAQSERAVVPTIAVKSLQAGHEPVPPSPHGDDKVGVTVVRRDAKPHSPSAFVALQAAVAAIVLETTVDGADAGPEGQRWPSVESRWPLAENLIEDAVARLNAALAPVAFQVGPAGEAGWSFKNRGFGSYRRITVGGRSIAWLRCETSQESMIILKVRAHAVEQALLNATASLPATGADVAQMLDVLSMCLRPAAETAAWALPKPASSGEPGQDAWSEIGALTKDAYGIAAGALREADAVLSELARPTWDPASGRTRWTLAVAVANARAAEITVDLVKRSFEITSRAAMPQREDLGRKRRLDISGLTAHGLAEGIAASAWPSVAAALESVPGATGA